MADGAERVTQWPTSSVREILPRSADIVEAFRGAASGRLDSSILKTASDLVDGHQRQWRAEDVSRAADLSADERVASKRHIDDLNARRVILVEQIDDLVADRLLRQPGTPLHTETIGSVIDRLAIAWVRATELTEPGGDHGKARLALSQLNDLARAYDDLVRDVADGRRQVPTWRSLKKYRSRP